MYCSNCGAQTAGRFCHSCGSSLEDKAPVGVQLASRPAGDAGPASRLSPSYPASQQMETGKHCVDCGARIDARAEICPRCGVRQPLAPRYGEQKSKVVAGLLALFLGPLGIHKFYLGQTGQGVAFLICSIVSAMLWIVLIGIVGTIVISIICLVEAIIYFASSEESFHAKYG